MRAFFKKIKNILFGTLQTYDVEYWDGHELLKMQVQARNWWEASKIAEDAGMDPFYIQEAKEEGSR